MQLAHAPFREHITRLILTSLHWLPVKYRADYKIMLLLLTYYKALDGLDPQRWREFIRLVFRPVPIGLLSLCSSRTVEQRAPDFGNGTIGVVGAV
ncbi:unnamed protein product [Lampetra planeri]